MGTDTATVARYVGAIQKGDTLPPITVAAIGSNRYVIDGYHRWAAASKAGLEFISADVRRMSLGDARAEALFANSRHGRSLSSADKQAVFAEYLAQGRHLEDDGLGGKTLRRKASIARDFGGIYSRGRIYALLRGFNLNWDDDDERGHWEGRQDEDDLEPPETETEAIAAIRTALDDIVVFYNDLERPAARETVEGMIRRSLEAIAPPLPESKLDI